MTISEIVKVVKGKELTPPIKDEKFCESALLITGNITMQSVRTAEMLDFAGILITRGKVPSEQVLKQAYESGIVIIGTNYLSFATCGLLHENGIRGFFEE